MSFEDKFVSAVHAVVSLFLLIFVVALCALTIFSVDGMMWLADGKPFIPPEHNPLIPQKSSIDLRAEPDLTPRVKIVVPEEGDSLDRDTILIRALVDRFETHKEVQVRLIINGEVQSIEPYVDYPNSTQVRLEYFYTPPREDIYEVQVEVEDDEKKVVGRSQVVTFYVAKITQ